ncbi:MAG: GNAT family N-acetyltransferase [Actinobacteria bacterium]|nr:GNAT family N-acetyltransferase [Actinomycetota bacterium]
MVTLDALAAGDADWLAGFLLGSSWPYHAGVIDEDEVADRLRQGYYDGPDVVTLIVSDGSRRIGLARVEDLDDDSPTFDLRIGAEHRGQGHGSAALRELTRWVFDTHDVERFEGTTRQDNVAMRSAFRSIGFVKEAHYRRGWPTPDGRLLDAIGYAMLRVDWETGTSTPVAWDDEPRDDGVPDGPSPTGWMTRALRPVPPRSVDATRHGRITQSSVTA